ncbi:LytTR family DNA-binding domain-containing protein [Asticcacaulis sp. AC402]|uniref:LytTR family DNA-binding domain-containing protein n=1 Tax=Asticcacaulis sp. AC402 TaxID=1282361 RepID=UPI0003C3F921|nr:LytTR family DNA-binding domain-containing protein [Asticcacaulis sp. AC402]ESQ74857.1 hypothetical protein ABAC402_11940 [Asticcacaulis sp. AC402]
MAALWRQPWVRTQLVAVGMAAFLTFVGANGTHQLPLLLRFAYWLSVMVAGTVTAQTIGLLVDRATRLNAWQEMAVMIAGITPAITLVVWLITAAFERRMPRVEDLQYYALPVLMISVVMAFLHTQVNRTPAQSHAFPEARMAEPGEAFRERLGFKYRHAAILALSAEDHYLRVHTSAGETLILMRLYDAIRELDGIEGSQIHRSWWVAKEAVGDVRRSDGKVSLVLKNGATAPVSRSYVKALKNDGWL